MDGKEVKCTCKVIYSKILLIAGIVSGALLAILGIVTITADTSDLFAPTFFQWYTTDIRKVSFTDDKAFSSTEFWARPHQILLFEWTTHQNHTIIETDANYVRLESGLKSANLAVGKEYFNLDNLTITVHYFCMSNDAGRTCDPRSTYHLKLHIYKGTIFHTNGILGNQNMRWTFFLLACLMVAFGVIMILGELHVPLITTKFTFFYYSFVKGIIYVGIGFLVMGMSNIFGLLVAIVMWVIGILNCIYGWRSVTSFQWNKIGARGTTTIVTRREYI